MMRHHAHGVVFFVLLLVLPLPVRAQEVRPDGKVPEVDTSFAIISAIKSISGIKPSSEFMDLSIKFQTNNWMFTMASVDVALSDVPTDSAGNSKSVLTEAGASIDIQLSNSTDLMRTYFAGPSLKIFDGSVYGGIHAGSLEASYRSPFFTSYLYAAMLWKCESIDAEANELLRVKDSYQNIYIEFNIHSTIINVLKDIRIKGGFLMPLADGKINGVRSRIVLEVPLGGEVIF
jgi:hypothetical protein